MVPAFARVTGHAPRQTPPRGYGGSPDESDYDRLRTGVAEVIRYARRYYVDLEEKTEWSEIQLRDKPAAITWLFSANERVPVRSPIEGLYFASSTSEAPGYDQQMEANAALAVCDLILAKR